MTWCLSWWTPSGIALAGIVVAFWAGVAFLGLRAWRHLTAARRGRLTTHGNGERLIAGTTTQAAPDDGARIRSTR